MGAGASAGPLDFGMPNLNSLTGAMSLSEICLARRRKVQWEGTRTQQPLQSWVITLVLTPRSPGPLPAQLLRRPLLHRLPHHVPILGIRDLPKAHRFISQWIRLPRYGTLLSRVSQCANDPICSVLYALEPRARPARKRPPHAHQP